MPFFNLNIRKLHELVEDVEGDDFLDLAAARSEAIVAAREIMSDGVRRGNRPDDRNRFEITDQAGRIVLVMPFAEAFVD
jgi:hypothetical protein